MMTAFNVFSVIKNIYVTADTIYECVQLVKTNQSQCHRLVERIRVIVEAIAELDQLKKIPDSNTFERGINALECSLKECYSFINEFTQQRRWYYQVLKSKKNEKQFEFLNQQLQNCLADLNLNILAKQITNRQQDTEDQKADAVEIKSSQAEILSLNQKMLRELKDFKGDTAQREAILAQQLTSLQWQLGKVRHDKLEPKELIPLDYQIPFFELTFCSRVAKGNIGVIYSGYWNEQAVAIKLLSTPLSGTEGLEFSREIKILNRLRNQHIVQFYGACLEESHACIVMEYITKGSLAGYLAENKLTSMQQKQIALDIALGLQYLHKNGLIHRDLHSANILLTSEYRAKIADFGLAKTYAYSLSSVGKVSQALAWCAPELLFSGTTSVKTDIYSFGTILWEIFTGRKPFADLTTETILNKIQSGKREELTAAIPKEIQAIINTCWSADPEKRSDTNSLIQQLQTYDPAKFLYRQAQVLEKAKDYKSAQQYYQQAVDLNLVDAFASLAMLFLNGNEGVALDKAAAYQLLLAAATKGYPRAMKNLAIMLDRGDGIVQDQKNAFFWYQRAGDPSSLERAQRLKEKLSLGR